MSGASTGHAAAAIELSSPLERLPGVDAAALEVLSQFGVRLVFDLATSPVFEAARGIAHAAAGDALDIQGILGRVSGAVVDAAVADRSPQEIARMPVSVLRGVGDGLQARLEQDLGVSTVTDLADYPPFVEARMLLDRILQTHLGWQPDPGTPPDLLPGGQDLPTDVAYYDVALVPADDEPEPRVVDLLGELDSFLGRWDGTVRNPKDILTELSKHHELVEPLDLLPTEPQVATSPRLGAMLRFEQAWHREGLALGQLLHCVALAPGETTNIAVIDWSRREAGSVTEDESQLESLDVETSQRRSVSEATSAVAKEVQSGWSRTFGMADADQYGSSRGDITGGQSYGAGRTIVHAQSASFSAGERSISAQNTQRIAEATQQSANSARARRATVVREVEQSERERISTRAITNYNHMHALTVQYHEVLQAYRTTVRLANVERLLYVPVKPLDFSDPAVVARFRHVLAAAALDAHTRELLMGLGDEPTVVYEAQRAWDIEYPDDAGTLTKQEARDRAKSKARARARWKASLSSGRIAGGIVDASGGPDIWSMLGSAVLVSASWPDTIEKVRIRTQDGTGSPEVTSSGTELQPGVSLYDVASVWVDRQQSDTPGGEATQQIALTFRTESGSEFELRLDFVWTQDNQLLLTVEEPERRGEILPRLQANALHYSAAVWASLSSQEFLGAIGNSRWQGIPIARNIDASPVAIFGNLLGFRWHGPVDDEFVSWEDRQSATPSMTQHVSMPTGGVFGEAVLGRALSAEQLDLTRFWNWQDSPIPFRAPELAAIQTGSRAQSTDLSPSGFAQALVQLQQLGQLPDPQGLGAVLQTLASAEMFRNMGGLAETIGLARTVGDMAASGAAHAATQAGANFATGASAQLELLRLIPSLVSTAAGTPMQPPGPGMSNITNAGATLNAGRRFDMGSSDGSRAASPSANQPSPSSSAAPGSSGSGTGPSSRSGSTPNSAPTPTPPSSSDGQPAAAPPPVTPASTSAGAAFDAIIGGTPSQPMVSPSSTSGSTTTQPEFLPDIPPDLSPAPGKVSAIPPVTSPLHERMMVQLRETMDESGVDEDQARAVLRQWYQESVKPLLRHAWTVDRFATSAFRQYFDWLASAAAMGLSDVADETHVEAFQLIEDCLRSAIQRAGQRMAETNNPDYLVDVVRWVQFAQAAGINSVNIDDAVASTPLRVTIEDLRLSSTPAAGEQADVTVVAKVRIGSHPPLQRMISVICTADGGNIAPTSGTASPSGEFVSQVTRDDGGERLRVTALVRFHPLAPFSDAVLTDERFIEIA